MKNGAECFEFTVGAGKIADVDVLDMGDDPLILKDFFPVSGLLLPFGFGQGTGQALNYGNIYEQDYGFDGGRSFGNRIG